MVVLKNLITTKINYIVIVNGKNFYDHSINSDIKQIEEIRELTSGEGEGSNRRRFVNYEYIKIHQRLIVVDLSRQKESDTDLKSIQQLEFIGKLKKY